MWSEFSSATYKNLPSVGSITYYQPFTGERRSMKCRVADEAICAPLRW